MTSREWTSAEKMLLRRALSSPENSAELLVQATAIDQLLQMGVLGPTSMDRMQTELLGIQGTVWTTRVAMQAAFKASKLLRDHYSEPSEWPSDTPDAIAEPDQYWPYHVVPASHGQEPWRDLDQAQEATQGERDRWRVRVQGACPIDGWRPGVNAPDDGDPDDHVA